MSTAFNVPELGYRLNRFTLHNSSPEEMTLMWAARPFTLPARDQVGPKAAKYDTGEPIPGTLVLEDGWTVSADGTIPTGGPPNWLAFEAIRNVLGVDPITKKATGVYAKAGISFLPDAPSKELVQKIVADGMHRYEESQIVWADSVVAGFQVAIQRSKEAGMAPPPPSSDYLKATVLLEKRKKEIEALYGKASETPPDDAELEFLAFAEAAAMEMATKAAAGKEVDKAELANKLLQDPEVRAHLQRKYQYRIRKKGYEGVPGPDEEG